MTEDDPGIIFSEYLQTVTTDKHHFDVEIYKTSIDPGWIPSVENQFGMLTISDNPRFFGDVLGWCPSENILREEGISAFTTRKNAASWFYSRPRKASQGCDIWCLRPARLCYRSAPW